MPKSKKPRLGRGLSSLLNTPVPVSPETALPSNRSDSTSKASESSAPPSTRDAAKPSPEATEDESGARLIYIDLNVITPNPHQPRRAFDKSALNRLADSIRQDGLMQPIVVRPDEQSGHYVLVAGERRWRAARIAELKIIPAILHDLSEQQMAEWALIENLQREDLDPIERAEAFRGLVDLFQLSHEEIAHRAGLERPTVSNTIRLLELDPEIQNHVRLNRITFGHARSLLTVSEPDTQRRLAEKAIAGGWSVRKLEKAVRQEMSPDPSSLPGKPSRRHAYLKDLEEQISQRLNTKVVIKPGRKKGSGTLCLDFFSLDQFDTILEKLGVEID